MHTKTKKIFMLIMVLMFVFLMLGCEQTCTNHSDDNKDYICDICDAKLGKEEKCENHIDEDKNNLCDICSNTITSTIKQVKTISTKKNDSFFPTKRSDLHREQLIKAYEQYLIDRNRNLESWGEYVIYNLTSEEKSEKYDLDIFEVYYENCSLYLMKYKEDIYQVSSFDEPHINSHCLNHIAITDINDDGYIEILTAMVSFAQRKSSYYCDSTIFVTDTYTKVSAKIYGWNNANYFKENSKGVMCIYKTSNIIPVKEDLNDGKLDEKYYDLAKWVYETPQLNITSYEFKEKTLKVSCELYEAEITINDYELNFPYIFENTFKTPTFKVKVKMKYLGETFSYMNSTGYLDGATALFKNEEQEISCMGWGETTVVTGFVIFKGMVIEREYDYRQLIDNNHKSGTYDMIINYNNIYNNIDESIIIEDFLKISR